MNVKRLSALVALLLFVGITTPSVAVDFTVSQFGNGSQIWFQAEDFDQRLPDTDDYFAIADPPVDEEALVHPDGFLSQDGTTINRIGGPGGRISYDFDISYLGAAGTWYFWGRVINPNNLSDFMLVEGSPGDIIPAVEPFSGSFTDAQRVFERNTGPPFGWSGGGEGHIKQLQDGQNTMHIVHRQGGPAVYWDLMVWTDDPEYVPTDEDFLESVEWDPPSPDTVGDFNGDGSINAADYQIMVNNFNTDVDRGQDGDITFSGHVDYRDFVALRSKIEAQGAGVQSVPEPSTWGLFSLAGLFLASLRRRRRAVATCLALAVIPLANTSAQEAVIVQKAGTDYIAFEAENYFDLNNGNDSTGWNVVGVIPELQFQSPAPIGPASLILDPSSTNASRRGAIFDFPGGGDQDYVRYRLRFVEDGDYSLYLRYSLYNLRNDATYGNEDSTYISSFFGLDGELEETDADPRGPRDTSPSFYATFSGNVNNEGTFGWWNGSADGSDTTADNPDAIYVPELGEDLDFGIAAREAGVAIDRIVFHTNPNLTAAELDALISFDPFCSEGCDPNDFNKDGSVDQADVDILRANFGGEFELSESLGKGDGNRDGSVDLADHLQIRQALNPAPGLASIPEPANAYPLLCAGLLTATWLRKRRR